MEFKRKGDTSGMEGGNPDQENEAKEMTEFEQIKDALLKEDIQGALSIVEKCIAEHEGMVKKEPAKGGLSRPSFDEAVQGVLNK